jgi:hypothetical protein
MSGCVLVTGQRVPPFAMSRAIKRNRTPAGKNRRATAPVALRPRAPSTTLHLRAFAAPASIRCSGSGPFGTAVPCRVHANIAFLSGSARVRLPAGSLSRERSSAPLSIAIPVHRNLSSKNPFRLLTRLARRVVDRAEFDFVFRGRSRRARFCNDARQTTRRRHGIQFAALARRLLR